MPVRRALGSDAMLSGQGIMPGPAALGVISCQMLREGII